MKDSDSLDLIKEIPDFPTLKRFASVLWREDNSYHGASIMVGAGFSRSAAQTTDTSRKLPLWFDFSNKLQQELGTKGNTDPLRIAEEYTAYFGRQALNELIKKEINDSAWEPGELYNSLLNLPWSEVLTTNWDTLLERAAENIHETIYSVVNKPEDLANACSPRIVKLHGTLNVTNDLIFTQEDYRTFPVKNAAFVNFSRQVFIENELCLLGFSGDDPNFLQWAGWVRDQLSTSARRIYLVGALGLNAAKRKYLESINIAPIDLDMLVNEYDDLDLKHKKATELFLSALNELKPRPSWEWHPSSKSELNFEDKLAALKDDRETYPGWIICPHHLRFELFSNLDHSLRSKKVIDSISINQREALLYELAWLYNTCLYVVPEWLANDMLNIITTTKSNILTKKQKLDMAFYVLKNCRWYEDNGNRLEKIAKQFINSNIMFWPECQDLLYFYEATQYKLRLKFFKLEGLIQKIKALTPEFKIKKATLYSEIGMFDDGEKLLLEAKKELLNKYRSDNQSVYLLSRLSLVDSLLVQINYRESGLIFDEISRVRKCQFWHQIDDLRRSVDEKIETQDRQMGIEVLFEPGSYRDKSNTINISNIIHPWILFEEITNGIGIPVRWNDVNFLLDVSSNIIRLKELDFRYRLYLIIMTVSNEEDLILERNMSRMILASISSEDCEELIELCIKNIDFWLVKLNDKNDIALTKLRVIIEVLARLSIRASVLTAKKIFNLATSLGTKEIFRYIWLRKSLNHLIKYSLESIPINDRSDIIINALNFPLETEFDDLKRVGSFEWPNPIVDGKLTRIESSEINNRINQIIKNLEPNSRSSRFALERLLPLIECGYLKKEELDKLRDKIWKDNLSCNYLPVTGLLHWASLKLPHYDQTILINEFKKYLFNSSSEYFFENSHLLDMINCNSVNITPTPEEAIQCFEILTSWKPRNENPSKFYLLKSKDDDVISERVAEALNRCIVPALSLKDLNEVNFYKILNFITINKNNNALCSLPYFLKNEPKLEIILTKKIREFLYSSDGPKITQAIFSIYIWRNLYSCDLNKMLVAALITMVSLHKESSLTSVIWCLKKLFINKLLLDDQIKYLSEIMPLLFDNCNYNVDGSTSKELVNISLLKAEIVKLVKKLNDFYKDNELERVLNEAKLDPLPEVRFAIIS